jgi:hypothetical protein
MFERDLHRWLTVVLRSQPKGEDIDDGLSLLGRLSHAEKKVFWLWLSQSDPNLKTWLKRQEPSKKTAMAAVMSGRQP